MFDLELMKLRDRMELIGRRSGRFHLHRPATPAQIEQREKVLGLPLPSEFREFLLRVTSGGCLGIQQELQIGPLIPENDDGFHFNYGGGDWFLVPFPLQHILYDEYQYRLRGWETLSAHEKMENAVGLCFAVWGPFRLAVLVLSGEERGNVWHGANYSGQSQLGETSFFEAFAKMLDQTK